ncbi:NADP-dependent succinic semialdehyde dehydrogenase [Leifsonia sp. NPDC077715]|uniref:NADP-dependent succinic semialdehyde dehydrogenase n=1 Tax=Leifsonia sp. NPDC077715 TaxID=3155539 RepID=UPI00342BDA18
MPSEKTYQRSTAEAAALPDPTPSFRSPSTYKKGTPLAIATVNPATGATERTFQPHDPDEIERRIARANEAVRLLASTTFAQRGEWMRAAADILESEVESLAVLMTTEMGKPIAQARAEAMKCAKGMRFYAENAEDFLATEHLADPAVVGASSAAARYEPLGVILAVMPWNYPLWQVIRFAAPALMAGNVGLLKHASNVPQCALYLDNIFERGGFPAGSFSVLLVGAAAVEPVIVDRRIKAVTLTGSEPAGRQVAAVAGAHIKKAVLELGGSDPFIVMPSADIQRAAEVAVNARVQNNGQSCIAAKRFIVHDAVYDEFASLLRERFAALRVGDPLDPGVDVGPIATEGGRQDLVDLVEDARERGATILTGGYAPEDPGWFYAPTLVADLPDDARLVMEEAFGPVASLYRVDSPAEALRIANQTTFGLSSSLWSADEEEIDAFLASLDAGAVFVNGMTVSYAQLPFGGIKDSGYGRELAAAGIREFCNLKTIWRA